MSHRLLTVSDLAPLLGRALGQSVDDVEVRGYQDRLYSQVWFIDAKVAGETRRFVAKMFDSDKAFAQQVSAFRSAHDTCTQPDVCIPYLGSVEESRILLMARVSDPTLDSLCHVSLRRPVRIPFVHAGRRNLEAACARVGRWLRSWHAQTAGRDDAQPVFAYLASRGDCLELISRDERDRITALVGNARAVVTCIPHGAFTPPNMLWSPQKLTVIDFGITEWERASPWWDCVSFEIGLYRALRFSPRHLGTWSPRLAGAAARSFWRAYGRVEDDVSVKRACFALRHLVFYADDTRSGYRRRAAWHRLQLRRLLIQTN